MNKVDFQNGFVCGMATRGLVRSGLQYEPLCYNDEGEFSFFYIDFRRAVEAFSIGQLTESLILYAQAPIAITNSEKVNESVYKIYANISGLPHGLVVTNKKTGRLRFATGDLLPPFSTHMFVFGQTSYIDGGYYYDRVSLQTVSFDSVGENVSALLHSLVNAGDIYDSCSLSEISFTASETVEITLI